MQEFSVLHGEDVVGDGVLMLCLGSLLFAVEPLMVIPQTESIGYRTGVILMTGATCLASWHLLNLLRGDKKWVRIIYLFVAELLVACWLAAWMIRGSTVELRILIVLCGVHGLIWGLRLLRLAIRERHRALLATMLTVLAACLSATGIAIATESGLLQTDALNVAACYTTFVGTVLVTLKLCMYKHFLPVRESLLSEGITGVVDVAGSSAVLANLSSQVVRQSQLSPPYVRQENR